MNRITRKVFAGACAISVVFGATNMAGADNVSNDVASTAAGKILTVQAGSSATVKYTVTNVNANGGDTETNCNLAGTDSLTITPTGLPVGVSAPAATVEDCGSLYAKDIVFSVGSGTTSGDYVIVHTLAKSAGDTGLYTNLSDFTLRVSPPPNTAPSTPGAPALSIGSNPNIGVFSLTWTASTDPEGTSVTYRLEHKDANDSEYSLVAGAGSLTANSFAFTALNPEGEGTWRYQVQASDGSLNSSFSPESLAVKVDNSAPNPPTLSIAAGQTATVVNGVPWYKDSLSINIADNGDPVLADASAGSGVNSASFTTPFSVTTNGTSTQSRTVKDNVANESAAGQITVNVDAKNPNVAITSGCPTGDVILGSTQSVSVTASDGESGLAADPSGTVSLDTTTVGQKTTQVTATDNVGHSASASCTYRVIFNWTGFFQPIDNPTFDTAGAPTTWNRTKAGSAVPVKFSLAGNQGLSIFEVSYPKAFAVACPTSGAVFDELEQVSTETTSGLKYDAVADQYNYTWKTTTTYGGKCYRLDVKLIDGTTHSAYFQFTK